MIIGDISTVLAALKSTADLIQLLGKSKVDNAVREKAFELQSIILDLQQGMFAMQVEQSALLQAKKELEQKIAELEQWEAEASHYQLHKVCTGVFVYAIKPEANSSEEPHWVAPTATSISTSRYFNGERKMVREPSTRA